MTHTLVQTPPSAHAPRIDAFLADAVAEYRAQLALLDDDSDRRGVEDAIALLTDYRLCEIDARRFEALLARMMRGRSPVALLASAPQPIAAELAARWQAYRDGAGTPVAARA
ncbi:MAG: hypothetical protein ACYDEB_07135 [Dehalococcoidia bacterium]